MNTAVSHYTFSTMQPGQGNSFKSGVNHDIMIVSPFGFNKRGLDASPKHGITRIIVHSPFTTVNNRVARASGEQHRPQTTCHPVVGTGVAGGRGILQIANDIVWLKSR